MPGAAARADDGPAALDAGAAARLEERLQGLAAAAAPRTVCVYGVIGLGSGAVVDPEGTVITNAHVAAGARYAVVLRGDGERLLYRRRGIDYEKDLAVLEPVLRPGAPWPCFTLAAERPAAGTWLAALGFPGGPRGADPHPTFTIGQAVAGGGIGGVMGVLDYRDAIRTDVPIFSGNSGGPLVDLDGRLVGLNGAVEFDHGAGMAIPAAVVAERLRTLRGGVIRLPGGRVLDPAKSRLVRWLEEALDPRVRDLMEARRRVDPGAEVPDEVAKVLPAEGDPKAAAAFLARTREAVRNVLLQKTFGRRTGSWGHAVRLPGGALATAISPREVVVCASALAPGGKPLPEAFADDRGRRFRVAGRAPELDLVLGRLESGEPLEALEDAPAARVGTLVAAAGPDGVLGAGVVSAPVRRISEAGARALAASGADPAERIVRWVREAAEALGLADVVELMRQLDRAFELRRGFASGSAPRGYAGVLSHDAPCGPQAAGAPLLDLRGRLVAVHVASAHYGTSYAVPIAAVRAALGRPPATASPEPRRERRREPVLR